jgi:hypothetical protein
MAREHIPRETVHELFENIHQMRTYTAHARFLAERADEQAIPEQYRILGLPILDIALTTFIFIKLSAVFETALNDLLQARAGEIDVTDLRFDKKISAVQAMHNIDMSAFKDFRTQRNRCAHTIEGIVTWDEVDETIDLLNTFAWRLKWERDAPDKPPLD